MLASPTPLAPDVIHFEPIAVVDDDQRQLAGCCRAGAPSPAGVAALTAFAALPERRETGTAHVGGSVGTSV